ncbi:hypothetical protein BJ508DRAFT_414800 [Ascobolus immersus RN42]|uniref:Mitochondrial integral membrane protein n=1 Tax=Ascobolus immersus RN42 TaxID=1160509 RepID=A0A3N4IAY6_ASCIM|nr:hypothetical protein BJ508DRAFT_414800 [Ascobolus immersus RN42]
MPSFMDRITGGNASSTNTRQPVDTAESAITPHNGHSRVGHNGNVERREYPRGEPTERTSLLPPTPPAQSSRNPLSNRRADAADAAAKKHDAQEAARIRQIQERDVPNPLEVDAYNLQSVRVLRYFTIFFLSITGLWLLLLLISIFATPPGMSTRGSGYTELFFATFTFVTLLIETLFFIVPSQFSVLMSVLLVVTLLVDTIMVVAVGQLRSQAGWVGVVSLAWAALMSSWIVVCGKVVEEVREEEEIRVNRVMETRRTVGEWSGVLVSSILYVGLFVVALMLTIQLGLNASDGALHVPGKKVFVDGSRYQLHVFCSSPPLNTSQPTFLVESGDLPVQSGLESLLMEAHQDGLISRYCYYDRPGYAFSDNAPSPLSAGMTIDALSEALARLGEDSDWILVSAGIGSLYSHVFASRNLNKIRSHLLLDPYPLSEPFLERLGSTSRGFQYFLRGLLAPLGIPNLFNTILSGATREARVFGRISRHRAGYLKNKLQENTVATTFTRNEIGAAREVLKGGGGPRGDGIPTVLISSREMMKDGMWKRGQEQMARGDAGGRVKEWGIVDGGHEVWDGDEGRRVVRSWLGRLERGELA